MAIYPRFVLTVLILDSLNYLPTFRAMCPNFGLGRYGPIRGIFILKKVTTLEFYFFLRSK